MSSLRRPFLALILFSVVYVFLALLGIGPGSNGLRSALFGIREDPFWGTDEPPTELKIRLKVQDIHLQYFNLTIQKRLVHCLESPWVLRSPYSQEVLILHGSFQPLSVWEETLRLLTTWGHRAVVVQLPDWTSRESSHRVPPEQRTAVITALLSSLQFSMPAVLVLSSRGGLYGFTYLQEQSDHNVAAFISIAAAVPSKCRSQDLQKLKIPGLVIYSEGDLSGARVAQLLSSVPKVTIRAVPPAKSESTSDLLLNPPPLHRLIYHFLLHLYQKPEDS